MTIVSLPLSTLYSPAASSTYFPRFKVVARIKSTDTHYKLVIETYTHAQQNKGSFHRQTSSDGKNKMRPGDQENLQQAKKNLKNNLFPSDTQST